MCIDTYFYLLELAQVHPMDLCLGSYEYETAQFDQNVYERETQKIFCNRAEAYQHWIDIGRSAGFSFAESKDTLCKIILKCKDDTEYIRTWIEYHAGIVGYHNIIIVDCGSTDVAYWQIVNQYLGRILILSYSHYYDDIHDYGRNCGFYRLMSQNSRYLTLLDADEFVFGVLEGTVSAQAFTETLASGTSLAFAGTWFNNISSLPQSCDHVEMDVALEYASDPNWIGWGSTAGKAVIRTDMLSSAGHVGHNLATAALAELFDTESFGTIGILHLNKLSRHIERKRSLRHLRAKRIVPADLVNDLDIERVLEGKKRTAALSPIDLLYIDRYLSTRDLTPTTSNRFVMSLSKMLAGDMKIDAAWADFQAFNFAELLSIQRVRLVQEIVS